MRNKDSRIRIVPTLADIFRITLDIAQVKHGKLSDNFNK